MNFNNIIRRSSLCFFLLLLVFIPVRFKKISVPLHNITSFRQAQTATVALNFHNNGIDLFGSELDIFGHGKEKYLTLELPLYQAIVSVLYGIFFVSDSWGRFISVTSGFLTAGALYLTLLKLGFNSKFSAVSAFFFLAAPLNMFHQQDFLIEPFVISFLMIAFYFHLSWIKSGALYYLILSMLFFALSFMQKIMYGPFLFLPLAVYYLRLRSIKRKGMLLLFASIIIPFLIYMIWQKAADMVNIRNNHAYFAATDYKMLEWNLGSLADRFSSSLWSFRVSNILNGIFLKPGLILFLVGIIATLRNRKYDFIYIWLVSQLLYFLVFFRIQSHIYYQMIIIPVTSVFMASGLFTVKRMLGKIIPEKVSVLFMVLIASLYLYRALLVSDWDAAADSKWHERLMKVGSSVAGRRYGVIVNPGYDWNSVYTYYPRLKLLTVSVGDLSEKNLDTWKKDDYSYLILHRYSEFGEYLEHEKIDVNLDFLSKYDQVLLLEDFKVYLL